MSYAIFYSISLLWWVTLAYLLDRLLYVEPQPEDHLSYYMFLEWWN